MGLAWVGAINYLIAASVCGVLWHLQSPKPPVHLAAGFGVAIGLGFAGMYWLLLINFSMVGAAISQCVARLSLLLPVLASILFFDRYVPGMWQAAGIVLVLASLPLLTQANPLGLKVHNRWKAPCLLVLFLLHGTLNILIKAYTFHVPEGGQAALLTFVFGTAFVGLLAAGIMGGKRPTFGACVCGVVLGLINIAANYCRLFAIVAIPGAIFFSVEAAAIVALSTVVGAVLWKERFSARSLLGLALAIAAVALISLR